MCKTATFTFDSLLLHCTKLIISLQTQNAISLLKQEYKDDGSLKLSDSLDLSIKVLSKTLDLTKLTADKGKTISNCLSKC